jgi:hypothetical protein
MLRPRGGAALADERRMRRQTWPTAPPVFLHSTPIADAFAPLSAQTHSRLAAIRPGSGGWADTPRGTAALRLTAL